MIKRITFSSVTVLSLFFSVSVFAQDPEFSQFYANPLYLNPAFAGSVRCPRFIMNYRNEWPGISGTYDTYHVSYDQHVDAISGGIGLMAMQDVAGPGGILTRTWLSAIYSYQLNVTREFSIAAGFQATYAQLGVNWSKLTFGDEIDPTHGFVYNTAEVPGTLKRSYMDFSTGILGYSKRYFFGFAADHLTQPDEGLVGGPSPLPMRIVAHAGAVIPLDIAKDGETTISPNILYMKQQDFEQILLGIYITKGPFTGGLWYRNQDAFIVLVGFQKDIFKFGYSYDLTVSKLTNSSAGANELSLQFLFSCKPKKKKFRTISCPSF
jgi:type IX secretion system PorP/SprF family membrane protein